ncbi:hypothetical protein [Thiolapillus sp.]|uniref:hypothetical protein n=1 Tax=Thiolapillus sp. TaxID=2017437 RepID=UPI003F9241B7
MAVRNQACLRPRDRFWDIPVPKIDSAFDNLLVPQPSWSPRLDAYFASPLALCARRVKQCGLAATGDYQPSLRSPWLAARARMASSCKSKTWEPSALEALT